MKGTIQWQIKMQVQPMTIPRRFLLLCLFLSLTALPGSAQTQGPTVTTMNSTSNAPNPASVQPTSTLAPSTQNGLSVFTVSSAPTTPAPSVQGPASRPPATITPTVSSSKPSTSPVTSILTLPSVSPMISFEDDNLATESTTPAPVVTTPQPSTVSPVPLSPSPTGLPSMPPSKVSLVPSNGPSSVPSQGVIKTPSPAFTKPTTVVDTTTSKPVVNDNITSPIAAPYVNDTITSPSAAPSTIDTFTSPTVAPSATGTFTSPVAAPSVIGNNEITANGTFSLLLFSVAVELDANTETSFRNLTEVFLGNMLASRTQPINNVRVNVTDQSLIEARQRRRLETLYPLRITFVVDGTFIPLEGSAQSASDIGLSLLCQELFIDQGLVFLEIIRRSNYPGLSTVTSIQPGDKYVTPTAPTMTVSAPTFAPISTTPSSDSSGLSLPIMIGIAVGAGVLIFLLLVLFCFCLRRQPPMDGSSTKESTALSTVGPNRAALQPPKQMNSLVSEVPSFADTTTLNGMDNMSYAYSLDHGIEDQSSIGGHDQSTIGGYDSQSNQSASVSYGRGGRMPMEIPNMSSSSLDTGDNKGKSQSVAVTKITRECFAPPGKLGIVIDTTMQGPVVHKVNAGSPLEGVLWPGDIIIAIDEVDTRAMSASAITGLMAKNMNKRRRLTVLSEDK